MSSAVTKDQSVEGVVIRSTGSWYHIQVGNQMIPSKVRGRFRLSAGNETNPVAVGDRVVVRVNEDKTGLITDIRQRTRSLLRRAAGKRIGKAHIIATNVDFAWVVQSMDLPRFNPGFVDRFLVMAALNEIPAGLIINKMDLATTSGHRKAVKHWRALYEGLGYEVLTASATVGKGIRAIRKRLTDQTSVVAGPSGVGKSTLLNAVSPGLDLRTGGISAATRKGTHTTTVASLHRLQSGGFVVDTPGLREFGLVGLEPPHLSHYMPEMQAILPNCRFPNCTHDHEPGCAIKAAVDAGEIDLARYDSYLGMLYSLKLGDADVGR